MSEKQYMLSDFDGEVEMLEKINEQQDTIITLKTRLEKINGGYGFLTHRNGLTANEWVIEKQEKELKKKNEQISEWIKQHSKDIKLIQNLKEENDNCKNDYRELFSNYVELEEQNEQLKSTITHLQEECGARENDYVNLKKQLDKIPPRIKEIWLNG